MDSTFWVFLKVSQLTHLCSQSFQASVRTSASMKTCVKSHQVQINLHVQ
jgi:hypothetical protein